MKLSGWWSKPCAIAGLMLTYLSLLGADAAYAAAISVAPNKSIFIQIANFIILIFILNKILYKPIRNILLQRKEKIQGLESSIDGFQKDALNKENAFDQGIRDARDQGKQKKDAVLQEAAAEEKAIIGQINEKAAQDLADVKSQIAADAEKARAALMQEVDAFAKAIGQKILGRAV